jgi:drug/metabolite transporter (DMT)-like permease
MALRKGILSMSTFWMGNIYLLLGMLCASGSQIVFKALFNEMGPLRFNGSFVQALCYPGIVLRVLAALVLLVAGFVLWMMSLSRLDLSYAYPVACSSAVIVALFSVLFLGEAVSIRSWCGTGLIVLGTALLTPSQ